jgi:iron complex transport system ATP-binding protein
MHALAVDGVSFSYDGHTPILLSVSLTAGRGELVGIVGPNGSGKTTLLRIIDRILLPSSGTVTIGAVPLARLSRVEIARRVAFVSQNGSIQFPFSVREIVLMGRAPHGRGNAFESAADRAIAEEMMRLTDIAHLAGKPVTALSGGERQRVFIARALAQQPEILLLDEPNAHLDIAHQIDTFNIIRRLKDRTGLTVLSVSHDLNLASAFSDRIVMLACGSVVAAGPPTDVLTAERIRDVFRTDVVVDTHPDGLSPRVTLRPESIIDTTNKGRAS